MFQLIVLVVLLLLFVLCVLSNSTSCSISTTCSTSFSYQFYFFYKYYLFYMFYLIVLVVLPWRGIQGQIVGVQVSSIDILIEQNRTEQYVNSTHQDSYQYVLLEHYSEAGVGREGYMLERMEGSTTGVQASSINILIVQNRTEQYVNRTHQDSYQYVLLEHFSEAGVGGRGICWKECNVGRLVFKCVLLTY